VVFRFGSGTYGEPLPDRLVEGSPTWRTWQVEQTADGNVTTGVWEVTPGAYRSIKGETWEFCTILSGLSELVEDGKQAKRLAPGDTFVMKPGFRGIWRVLETTRKLWVTVEHSS
jgi:uncharacterized cupin superfamily protein